MFWFWWLGFRVQGLGFSIQGLPPPGRGLAARRVGPARQDTAEILLRALKEARCGACEQAPLPGGLQFSLCGLSFRVSDLGSKLAVSS